MLMHLCFGIGTNLGIFSWISMTALVAFMPDMVWQWCITALAWSKTSIAHRIRSSIDLRPTASMSLAAQSTRSLILARSFAVLGVTYIVYMFLWQAVVFAPIIRQIPWWNTALQIPAKVARLDQHWTLFAPHPYTDDGWDVIVGHLSDGSTVDLFRNGAPISYEKPTDVYAIYYYSHVREYTLELRRPQNEPYRKYYAQYLCATWNAVHTGGQHLDTLEHIFMLEKTPPPGYAPNSVVQLPLINYTCPVV
jgi:hypothetical protein